MKRFLASLLLGLLLCNSVLAQTVFYEDYSFYGELVTDIRLNKVERSQVIQVAFPSFLKSKVPSVLKGHAYFKEIDDKPYILLELDELSVGGQKYIPVKVLVTAIDGKKLKNALIAKDNRYINSVKFVNTYSQDVFMFPINRYKNSPTIGKPRWSNFVMLLEPVYALLGTAFYLISPISAIPFVDEVAPDIKKASVIEFEFLQEVGKKDLMTPAKAELL